MAVSSRLQLLTILGGAFNTDSSVYFVLELLRTESFPPKQPVLLRENDTDR
jgi:hypothetical protein